jgi:hypothetical protein
MSPAVPAGRSAEGGRACPMVLSAGVVTGGGKFSGALAGRRSLTSPDAGEGSRGLLGKERWEALMAGRGMGRPWGGDIVCRTIVPEGQGPWGRGAWKSSRHAAAVPRIQLRRPRVTRLPLAMALMADSGQPFVRVRDRRRGGVCGRRVCDWQAGGLPRCDAEVRAADGPEPSCLATEASARLQATCQPAILHMLETRRQTIDWLPRHASACRNPDHPLSIVAGPSRWRLTVKS